MRAEKEAFYARNPPPVEHLYKDVRSSSTGANNVLSARIKS